MNAIRSFLSEENGQTATEYMLLLSVVVVAVVAGAWTFVPAFRSGTAALGYDILVILDLGKIGDTGTDRS